MAGVSLALLRSFATLAQPRVWLLLLGPAMVALMALLGLGLFALDALEALFLGLPPMSWLAQWGAGWLAGFLALLAGWLVILAAAYLVAMLLAAIFILPLLLNYVAARDYPELARLGRDSFTAAAWNSVSAGLLFLLGWLLTLPLWLVPGLGLILPMFWMAWLNRRTFAYDALAVHASDDEWRALQRRHSSGWMALGGVLALVAHVPLLGLMAPALAALAYIHHALESLRRLRESGAAPVIIEQSTGEIVQ